MDRLDDSAKKRDEVSFVDPFVLFAFYGHRVLSAVCEPEK
jgi:hypothetical protein